MDCGPDPALINSPNINSVLKPTKPRVPLKDLISAVPEEDNTAARKRRVSFANVNKIKEFSAGAESMVVCQTPAYEEPFSVSSDSSYPSGVDGWTPAKVQTSVHGKPPIFPEKENLSVQSLRMSTGMDLTSLVGNSVRSSRYSVNGMDLTGVANPHETYIDQQTRFSVGMDLTSIAGHPTQNTRYSVGGMDLTGIAGHPSQNMRYSVSGMDLTNMSHSNQVLAAQGTRFSMGMDFTNVIGHSTQSTRYSINGMDLTEAVNPQQTFLDQRSARFSVGMDMTNVVGNPMKYSGNEKDLAESVNPYCYKKQSCEGGFSLSANVSMDDSDALELTEAVDGVQFSAISPKYKINDRGLAGNVLYSVNNTRYSVNSMDMTSAAGARRKSSRYSLVNMDFAEAINNSCDDLEFTQAVGDPIIKGGSTRNSVCEMELAESIIDERKLGLCTDNMDHTSVVGEQLEYSTETESIMNMTTSNNLDPSIYDKENVLSIHSFKPICAPTLLSHEDPMYVDSKLSNMSLCTAAHEPLPEVIPQHPIIDSHLQNTVSLNNRQSMKHNTCGNLLDESPYKTELPPVELKEDLSNSINESRVIKPDSKGKFEDEDTESSMKNSCQSISLPLIQKEGVVGEILNGKETSCINNEKLSKLEISVCHVSKAVSKNEKPFVFNSSNFNVTEQNNGDALNRSLHMDQRSYEKELNLNDTGLCVDNLDYDSSRREHASAKQHNSCTDYLTLQNESKNKKSTIENKILNEDAMDFNVTDNSSLEKNKCNITKELHSFDIGNPETHSPEIGNLGITTLTCPEEMCSLNESVMSISIGNCSSIKEVEDTENIYEKAEGNEDCCEKDVSVHVTDYEINRPANKTINLMLEENHQEMVENITAKDQSIDSNAPTNTSLNLSSRSVLCNKNITMTRGCKSLIITPNTSLEISNTGSRIVENEATSIKTTTITLKPHEIEDRLNQSENRLKHGRSSLQFEASQEKRGKRSFEAALEPENDTEESPIKQLCMLREDPSTEYEILSNVTAPSFLMDTVAASNETLPCLDQHETTAVVHQFKQKPTSPTERNMSIVAASASTCDTKQEFSLRMDDSLIRNMSENPLRNEVIDLCESSFDATSTEVRDLINHSRYKTRNICDDEFITKRNESFNCLTKEIDSSPIIDQKIDFINQSFDQGRLDRIQQSRLMEDPLINDSLSMSDAAIRTNVLEREVESITHPLPPLHHLKTGSRRKQEKIRTLGNNCYAAELIPNLVEIHFSIDSFDNVTNVSYLSICTGGDTIIGEYLMKQAQNYLLPEKGSDLILQLQSSNKSYLARLARNVNIICKYHSGSIKGDVLTLEVASCKDHFWAFINVNIKHPQYINQTDVTISKQNIGELKLSHVRKVFNSIEKNQDQLLNFAKAITEMQYNN